MRKAIMQPKQYQAALDELGLNHLQAADFLGIDERTSRRWSKKVSRIPRATKLLLTYMVRAGLTPADVEAVDR
jgi:hypothetical protein